MMNVVILVGRLGKDPEVHEARNGKKYVNLSIATSKKFNGNQVTQWHNVTVFGDRTVDAIARHLHKGSEVAVRGELTYRKYVDRETGQKKFSVSIVVGGNGGEIRFLSEKPYDADLYEPEETSSDDALGFEDESPF